MSFPATLTNDQIVHEVICNRNLFSLCEIESILASILDPQTIDHNKITRFVVNLPRVKSADLNQESKDQNCGICLSKYGKEENLDKDTPAKLPCGHVIGAECIKLWLQQHKSCPLCRREVFTRTFVSGHLNDPKLEQAARDFLFFLKTYLLEETTKRFTSKKSYISARLSKPGMYDDYSSFVAWVKEGSTVAWSWNKYWYGWSGRTQMDPVQFRTNSNTVAHSFILEVDKDYKPYHKKDCKTALLKLCKRNGGVGNDNRLV